MRHLKKMPRYVYKCSKCGGSFITVHGIMEDQDFCELCYESSCIGRIPQMPTVKIVKEEAGKLVREYIEDTKKDLKEEKKRLKEEDDKIS